MQYDSSELHNAEDRLTNSGCPFKSKSFINALINFIDVVKILTFSIASFLTIALILQIIDALLQITHLSWQRLLILIFKAGEVSTNLAQNKKIQITIRVQFAES